MADFTGHPDDELLFDFVQGALDESRAEQVRGHLNRCAACAAFVEAATVGAEAATLLVEPMPSDAASTLEIAMATAWRERRDSIAATEATEVIETVPVVPGVPETSPAPRPAVRRPRRRARRFVPILAFAVLALLAGTSVYVGQQQRGGGGGSGDEATVSDDAAGTNAATDSTALDAPASSPDAGWGSSAAREASAPPQEAVPGEQKADQDAAVGGSSGDYDDYDDYDDYMDRARLCIATRDQTRLYLPDGRVAQQILTGPLGIYVVCG